MNPIKNLTELKNATIDLTEEGVKPAIEFEIVPGHDSNKTLLEFEYEITSFDG